MRGRHFRYRSRGLSAFAAVLSVVLVLAVGSAGASGQDTSASGVTHHDIAVRDGLIADQESLLNAYRCRFGVDTHIVKGGCAQGVPLLGPTAPGVFTGTPTQYALYVRDVLVREQEALLNNYRCMFDIDTQVVPGGCASMEERRLAERLASLVLAGANDVRDRQAPLVFDDRLSDAARARAMAQADAGDWQDEFDYGPLLLPHWQVWFAGISTWTSAPVHSPGLSDKMSESLLSEYGHPRLQCQVCTHLGLGLASAYGRTYATVVVATPVVPEAVVAEAEMAALVNELRQDLGLDSLEYHDDVAAVARRWSQTMAAQQSFKHNPRYSDQYPPGWRQAAENIAWNSGYPSLTHAVRLSFNGLVDSPGHYANMTDPHLTHLGVGIALQANGFWVTQNFAAYP